MGDGLGTTGKVGDQGAGRQGPAGQFAVLAGIDFVEPTGQHADGGQTGFPRGRMGTAIDSQGHSTDDQRFLPQFTHAAHDSSTAFAAIPAGLARAYDGQGPVGVQVGRSLIVEHQRGIGAGGQAAGIGGIVATQQVDVIAAGPGHFVGGPVEQGGVEELVEQGFSMMEQFGKVAARGLEKGLRAAEGVHQLTADGAAVRKDFAQRTQINEAVGLHIFFAARYEVRPSARPQKSNILPGKKY